MEVLSTSVCSIGTGVSSLVDVKEFSCLHVNNTVCSGIMRTGFVGISMYVGSSTNGVVSASS
eukprot:2130872-Lingulodinium_polyedra.AAC.1